jgi:predicted glycogen debranching enzyme
MSEAARGITQQEFTPEAPDEWLVANGLGGYASAAVSGEMTRRYHGLLIAALPAPLGRLVVLNHLEVAVQGVDGAFVDLHESARFLGFTLKFGLPSWRYQVGGMVIEKSIVVPSGHNIVHVGFRLVGGKRPVRLRLRPLVSFRALEAPVSTPLPPDFALVAREGGRYEVTAASHLPPLRLEMHGANGSTFTSDGGSRQELSYRTEALRGYESVGSLWSPGYFCGEISNDEALIVVAATASWQTLEALTPSDALAFELERRRRLISMAAAPAQQGLGAQLVLAADAFVITPVGRAADVARARAQGDEVRTVIAGYHWFTDWGRDTMISLEGLTLVTGRPHEARWILRAFANYVRDGLIPNMFPECQNKGLYNTADASLWFFHALSRYVARSGDRDTLRLVLPVLKDIVGHHLQGTRFGIRVDPADGLLTQGAEGYQLTWMDAKVGDWVVTPRRGKAVEINALWYNALCLLAAWLEAAKDGDAASMAGHAEKARASFNRRFWHEAGGHLFDVVDGPGGDDARFRPNQIFALSLDHPVLDAEHREAVVVAVRDRLLTPVGLRSLAVGEPDFKAHYFGDVRSRDAAYHQGTVWAWLMGPFIDAWLRVYPQRRAEARAFLDGFGGQLATAGVGYISEIFDAEPPFTPRGCIAQAWSVAEILRSLVATAG